MHALEIKTCFGPVILMSRTRKQLLAMFRRFLSPSSLAIADEPDEIVTPPISEAKRLSHPKMSTVEG